MCTIRWSCIGPSVYGVFIPCSSGTQSLEEAFTSMTDKFAADDGTAYGLMKLLNSMLTESRFLGNDSDVSKDILTQGVRQYWSDVEKYYAIVYEDVIKRATELYQESPQEAFEYLTTYTKGIQRDQLLEARTLYEESQLALMTHTSTKGSRYAVSPFIDAEVLAKRYGWTCEMGDDRATFTRGDDTVTIFSPGHFSEDGKIEHGGTSQELKVHVTDGRYRIQYTDASVFILNGEPVAVDYSSAPSDDRSGIPVYVPVILVAAVLAVACAVFVIKRR